MTKRESISVSFTPEQAEFLAACVRSGRYQSTSEVVRAAVRLFEDQEAHRRAEIERARSEIKLGAEHLDQGRTLDAEAFFAEWDAELDDLEAGGRHTTA